MSKYNAKKTTVDGITFDSKREARRYEELRTQERAGKISGLVLQPKFELVPKGHGERAVTYTADFMYTENGEKIVEDVKGVRTEAYNVKRKLFKARYGDEYTFRETH